MTPSKYRAKSREQGAKRYEQSDKKGDGKKAI